MILINLLPHREIARKRRQERFNINLVLSVLVGGLLASLIYLWFQAQISTQQGKNQLLQSEISKFDLQIKEIAGLEGEIAALLARQQAVENLQADRNMPVYLLTELVHQLPEGVYIVSLKQEGQNVALQGVAQSNERVSELLRNLSNNSPWFTRPELVEIVAGTANLTPRDVRRVANFQIRVKLVRPNEAQTIPAQKSSAAASAGVVR
ncbi:PilN domain-containing protein [Rhodoferax sp.]|uniref:PilN domain-containing protein n=1 Tax=Rhodoferax sp. TaxID=50421 RepID=UPI0025F4C833|nr:PilN domain-containing protein [Rhodoferax sp.]MCM2295377.1 PilN domain-containing protein [Rhodoferax sp.]